MPKSDVIVTDTRLAKAWYICMPGDFFAYGPVRFPLPATAQSAVDEAWEIFGSAPMEVYPDGETYDVGEYEYDLSICSRLAPCSVDDDEDDDFDEDWDDDEFDDEDDL
jgi:hypothetical protein